MVKVKALRDFGEAEKKVVSDEGISEGDEFQVDDEQARNLVATGAVERCADQTVEATAKAAGYTVPHRTSES